MTEQAIAGGGGSADPEDSVSDIAATPPTEPGWYTYDEGAATIVFHMRKTLIDGERKNQWSVHSDNGSSADCEWGFIEQALSVFNLVRLVPETSHKTPAIGEGLRIGG